MAAESDVKLPKATRSPSPKKLQSTMSSKLLYVLVQDDPMPGAKEGEKGSTPRYTRPLLQSTLQLMGCKPRHGHKVL